MTKHRRAEKKILKALRKKKVVRRRKLMRRYPDLPIQPALGTLVERKEIKRVARGEYRAA